MFDEIQTNEIKMKDEVAAPAVGSSSSGLANAIAGADETCSEKPTCCSPREWPTRPRPSSHHGAHTATHCASATRRSRAVLLRLALEHVKPMFEVAWMPFLAGISGPLQESDDPEVVGKCLEGFRDAIKIVSFFGLELERNAFVTTLASSPSSTTWRDEEQERRGDQDAARCRAQRGQLPEGSWREVLTCVSQLERFQLISGGMDGSQLPDLGRRIAPSSNAAAGANGNRVRPPSLPNNDVLQAGGSSEVTVAADRVFSASGSLSGTAIV